MRTHSTHGRHPPPLARPPTPTGEPAVRNLRQQWLVRSRTFEVAIPSLDFRTTVGTSETILGALERAGLDVMSDCRRGECGLCELSVVEVSGRIDHRDVFYSEKQKTDAKRLCACVSRVVGGGSTPILTLEKP